MKWAFSDESRRKRTYLMAAIVVPTHAVNDARREARGFLRKNQRRVHMAKERPARRNQFLGLIAGLEVEGVAVQIALSGITDPTARTRTLSALASDLVAQEVEQWTLDSIDRVERQRDRRDISAVVRSENPNKLLRFDHQPSASEPMLWIADAVAWDATHDRRLGWVRIIDLP